MITNRPFPCCLIFPKIDDMGMVACLLRVSQNELDEFCSDSTRLEEKIDEITDHDNKSLIDLDKSWDGILFLLTGSGLEGLEKSDHPLSDVMLKGSIIDEGQDLGYGPAMYILPYKVKEIHNQLSRVSDEELKNRFDPEAMKKQGIYPDIWEDEESLAYALFHLKTLREFYRDAAAHDQAVISFAS